MLGQVGARRCAALPTWRGLPPRPPHPRRGFGLRTQDPSSLGQREAARGAMDQPFGGPCLQPRYRPLHGRSGRAQFGGGGGEGAGLGQASRSGRDMAMPPEVETMTFHLFCFRHYRRAPPCIHNWGHGLASAREKPSWSNAGSSPNWVAPTTAGSRRSQPCRCGVSRPGLS
jgi:hypothetical protein